MNVEKKRRPTPSRAQALEAVRRQLERRYESAFGCAWPQAPWGATWSEVLADCLAADEQYVEAARAIRDIAQSLERAIEFLGRRGHELPAVVDPAKLAGLTPPEAFLLEQFTDYKHPFTMVFVLATRALQHLEGTPGKKYVDTGAMKEIADVVGDDAPAPGFREYVNRNLKRNVSRRLALIEVRNNRLDLIDESRLAPCLVGPPPRTLSGDEWRRATLVEMLDFYPLHPDPSRAPGFMKPPTDNELGTVSLLAGRLENVQTVDLVKGDAHVLNAERKAIALARERRGLTETLVNATAADDADGRTKERADGPRTRAKRTKRTSS